MAPFTPCVEVAWRLYREFWGRSLAYRAATQAIQFGFASLKLPELVSFTAVGNERSRRLMERLGFNHDPTQDFDHPLVPEGHALDVHLTLTDDHPWAQAFVILYARKMEP